LKRFAANAVVCPATREAERAAARAKGARTIAGGERRELRARGGGEGCRGVKAVGAVAVDAETACNE
jgi:hypothetical protein